MVLGNIFPVSVHQVWQAFLQVENLFRLGHACLLASVGGVWGKTGVGGWRGNGVGERGGKGRGREEGRMVLLQLLTVESRRRGLCISEPVLWISCN